MESGNNISNKRQVVESMFDAIAWRYDFLNHFLSLGIDTLWRKRAVKEIGRNTVNPVILDVATGTADLAIASLKIRPASVTGVDISKNMLSEGLEKIRKLRLDDKIKLMVGDSLSLPFADGSFDVAMAAFGVRNFAEPLKGLAEMNRVLRKGGFIMILEFSRPARFPFRTLYNFYFLNILPFVGKLFSRDRSAYRYLPESVMKFPDNEDFIKLLREAGFSDTGQIRLTGGIASIYTGKKQEMQ